jgi:hypothetical protein
MRAAGGRLGRKDGGHVIEHGAGGARGRMEKISAYGGAPHGEDKPSVHDFENKANTHDLENKKAGLKKGGCA